MDKNAIINYAKLLLQKGVNLQKGQLLLINASTEIDYFVQIVAEQAFEMGAGDVEVIFENDVLQKLRAQYAQDKYLEEFPQFKTENRMYYAEREAAYLALISSDPDGFKGADFDRLNKMLKASAKGQSEFKRLGREHKISWNVAAVPGRKWAEKLFPDSSYPIENLWEVILKCSYADTDNPVLQWQNHLCSIKSMLEKLNSIDVEYLHITSSIGTDIKLSLCEDAVWLGGTVTIPNGTEICPNIPTEELYSAPHKNKVNGRVAASMPLVYNGNLIENFYFDFKDGEVVNYYAEKGMEFLKSIMDTDSGAKRLGEIALVPYSSPIRKTGMLFYNTLFDENAACHFALGDAYASSVNMSVNTHKTLEEKGKNTSSIHVDFMFGTQDLKCTAVTKNKQEITVMENGEFIL